MSDTKEKCTVCGDVNEGKYYKFHYGRWLKEGEDFLLETSKEHIYRRTTYSGGAFITSYFLKGGDKEVFICSNCYEREKSAHGKSLTRVKRRELGSRMAIEVSNEKNVYEECITDGWFRTFRGPASAFYCKWLLWFRRLWRGYYVTHF